MKNKNLALFKKKLKNVDLTTQEKMPNGKTLLQTACEEGWKGDCFICLIMRILMNQYFNLVKKKTI